MNKIMIVDDDENIAELIGLYLKKEGYEIIKIQEGDEAINKFSGYAPNLIILDIMLKGMSGYDVCREIRKTSNVPIVMLTAKCETIDKVLGLELGADDYIVKPFEPQEMVARVKAVLRRYQNNSTTNKQLIFNNLCIDLANYTVMYCENKLELPKKEFELLCFLSSNANQVFTRDQLLDKIWGYEFAGDTRTVDVHIKRLREKLCDAEDENGWDIKTVWGVGYKFEV